MAVWAVLIIEGTAVDLAVKLAGYLKIGYPEKDLVSERNKKVGAQPGVY